MKIIFNFRLTLFFLFIVFFSNRQNISAQVMTGSPSWTSPTLLTDGTVGSAHEYGGDFPLWAVYNYSPTQNVWNSYSMSSGSVGGASPSEWTISGSNDGTNWTTLDTHSGISWTSTSEVKDFQFINSTSYSYYKIIVTKSAVIWGSYIGEMSFSFLATDHYQSSTSGNWSSVATWQTSTDGVNWIAATAVPNILAASVTIQNGHTVAVDASSITASLTLNSGSVLTINPGKQFTVITTLVNNGTLNLNSDGTNGTGTIITPATISGTGTVNVQQYLTAGRNWYISSPVTAATTTSLSSATSVGSYNEPTASWITESGSLTPMKGYISVNNSTSGNITFSGTLNNGDQTITPPRTTGQTKEGFNLVGNPYPSFVNWTAATKTNLLSTMWYRTKSASAYVFDTYNATGGVGTSNGSTNVSNLIPPMQAFWVRVESGKTSGTLGFTNAMRSHADVSSNSLKAPLAAKASQPLLRLQVSNGTSSDETIVYFNANASNGYDDYDSPKITNANAAIPEIYTTEATEHLVINGLNSIPYNQEVPLGLKTGNSNLYTIKATEIKNFESTTRIFLKDYFLNTEFDLTDGATYELSPEVSLSDTSRFKIIFKSQSVISEFQSANDLNNVQVYQNGNHQITVNTNDNSQTEYSVIVCNSLGQMLENKRLSNSTNVLNRPFSAGVYFVTVYSKGKSAVRKIIIH